MNLINQPIKTIYASCMCNLGQAYETTKKAHTRQKSTSGYIKDTGF